MIKCIIFDCDGTLVDSEWLCNLGLEIRLQDYGIHLKAKQLMKRFRGEKLSRIIETIESEHDIKLNDDFIASYRLLVAQLFEDKLKPCDGVAQALNNIQLLMCVASSGPLIKINKALSITNLSHFFNENIFSSYDVGSWKPQPGIFLHAAKKMGCKPSECVVIEDSPVGVTAALLAGMTPILYDPNQIHDSDLCDIVIKHMNELSDVIDVLFD